MNASDGLPVRLYDFKEMSECMGPYKRCVIWLQGCPRACPGCMSTESRSMDGGIKTTTKRLLDRVLSINGIEGVTISGGDPFVQKEALARLCQDLQEAGLGVVVYTGYTLEELKALNDKDIDAALEAIDILIDGQYVDDLNDGRALVGSSNQRVIQLSERYTNIADEIYNSFARKIEVVLGENNVVFVGIPTRGDLEYWRNIGNTTK